MVRQDAERLRRRLYARGASESDVERYRALGVVPAVAVLDPIARRPARRHRPSAALVPLLAVAAIVGGVAVARVAAHAATLAVVAVIPPPTTLPVSSADRDAIREALASGDEVSVGGFLLARSAPPALATATRSLIVEQAGLGTATVDLDPASADVFQGRATVLLVVDRGGEVGWTAFRRDVDAAGRRTLVAQQRRQGPQQAGGLTADTFRYGSGAQPVEVRVTAPPGSRWAVEVVFTD